MRWWLDVLQWDLQSMPCSGNVYGYNIDGEQTDVDKGGQGGWLRYIGYRYSTFFFWGFGLDI